MKKLLLGLLGLFIASNCYAGIISYDTITSDAVVTYATFNNAYSRIYNEFNGNIEDVNLKADTLTERVFADSANPRVRDYEIVGDWTYAGMLPVTDTDLTSDISAGTSYVLGYRIVTDATAKTYTASKDTWVYIDSNGAFQYSEVANGAAQPTTPANSLLLAKVVTNGTAITTVTDYRQLTPPNLRIYSDFKNGLVISRDITTATRITIGRGSIELGSTGKLRRNTATTNIDTTTTGLGGLDTGTLAAGYYYVYALADTDNSANYKGIASTSSTDATGVTGERLVGWFYAGTTSHISPDSIGAYRALGGDAPNIVRSIVSADTVRTIATTAVTDVPGMARRFVSSGRPVRISARLNVSFDVANSPGWIVITINGLPVAGTEAAVESDNVASGRKMSVFTEWTGTLEAGTYTISVGGYVTSGTAMSIGDRTLIIEEK